MLVELSVMEQRYRAVLAVVQDGWRVVEVARRLGVSRQTVHAWIARYEQGGLAALAACAVYWPRQLEGASSPTAVKVGAGAAAKSPVVRAVPLGQQEAARIDSTLCPLRLPRTRSG